jgi:D-alanyl-D-alanine carboxypeptidase/D-alanyl-D-alanine-endopeptidase (penicillin-binding protein 4)
MKRFCLALAFAIAATPAAAEVPGPVRTALAKAGIPLASVGLVVERVDGGRALFAHRETAPMSPASVMKLVTSYAALDLLGPAYTFKTDVLITGSLAGGVLQGDLVLRGGGDPKLTYERLWQLLERLHARGVREVRGDVILDRGFFAPAPFDPGRFDNDPRRAYNTGPDALLVNFGAIDFHFIPEGSTVRVVAEPDMPNVEIQSAIAATGEPCSGWRRELKQEVLSDGLIATVSFTGRYPSACGEKSWPLAVMDGTRFTESAFRWLWSATGGVLRGKVREGPTPTDARLVLRNESEPLAALVRDMNKFSNNVMARHLFLALSASGGAGGEAAASARIVEEWLVTHSLDARALVMDNGSGLSREARATPAFLAALLRSAWSSALMPELVSSLPVYGVDGTLKERHAAAVGVAHLKGGTLNGVQCVAGYVLDRAGQRWVVVMMVNHANAGAAQPAIDALVGWIHAQDRKGGSR